MKPPEQQKFTALPGNGMSPTSATPRGGTPCSQLQSLLTPCPDNSRVESSRTPLLLLRGDKSMSQMNLLCFCHSLSLFPPHGPALASWQEQGRGVLGWGCSGTRSRASCPRAVCGEGDWEGAGGTEAALRDPASW